VFVRIKDSDVLGPLADSTSPHLDVQRPFPVDWVTIIMTLCFKTPRTNTCIFIEAHDDSSYDAHKEHCGALWQSISDTRVLGAPPCIEELTRGWRDDIFSKKVF